MCYIPNCLAVWKPAITVDLNSEFPKFEENATSIKVRTTIVALASFQALLFLPFSTTALLGAIFAPIAYNIFEHTRAGLALNQIAVDIFKIAQSVPEIVMDYMARDLAAAKRLTYATKSDLLIALKKPSSQTGALLLEKALNKKGRYLSFDEEKQHLEVLKSLIDAFEVNKETTEQVFLPILQDKNFGRRLAVYLLEKNKIIPENVTAEQLWHCFKTHNVEVLRLMLNKGFKTHLEQLEIDGVSPYLDAIIHQRLDEVREFAAAGLEMPRMYKQFVFNKETITLETFFHQHPKIYKILGQVYQNPKFPEYPKLNGELPFPFLKPPVVDFFGLHIEEHNILARTICAAQFPFVSYITISPWAALPCFAVVWLYNRWEWSRSTKLANEIALKEFQSSLPHQEIFDYIVHQDPSFIDRLQGDLTKINDAGYDLWQYVCKKDQLRLSAFSSVKTSLAMFQKLADKIFQNDFRESAQYFLEAISSGRPEFVAYLLLSGKVKAEDFSKDQQVNFWENVNNLKTAQLLQKHGFDVNAKNNEGYTPLLKALSSFDVFQSKCTLYERVSALLECGADVNAKVFVNNKLEGVLELCKDEPTKRLLKDKGAT